MSTVEALFDALDESRERLLVAIEPLDDDALLQKQVVGEWSIADVLTNITAWEAELVTGLLRLDQNRQPGKLLGALADPAAYDRVQFDDTQNRDLDQIFDDLQQVRVQTEDWLSAFSERDLTDWQRYNWLDGRSLLEIIEATTYRRELSFLPAIESFSQAWLSQQNAIPDGVIPLTTIESTTQELDNENTN